jgi:ketosteroid isomerase-like protein
MRPSAVALGWSIRGTSLSRYLASADTLNHLGAPHAGGRIPNQQAGGPVIDLQGIADRFEIEALRGEFSDAVMTRDYDRLASLFTPDGAWRIPDDNVDFVGRGAIRAGVERLRNLWVYFVQTTHPGMIRLDGQTACGRAYIAEFGHLHNGKSELNYAVYHDHYQRTADGWKFTERVFEIKYLDTTPLAGAAPYASRSAS